MGLIGTDAICATAISEAAAEQVGAFVAPTLAYTPAAFNSGFPGTISVAESTFLALFKDVMRGLVAQGFTQIYVLNAHGANLAPMQRAAGHDPRVCIRSWWDFEAVNTLRLQLYGAWEGLHATPSDVAITQALLRTVKPGAATSPPRTLSVEEVSMRKGDRHGPPQRHRSEFPDGRVGAHSALATPEDGGRLLDLAAKAVAKDFEHFIQGVSPSGSRPP